MTGTTTGFSVETENDNGVGGEDGTEKTRVGFELMS